MKRQSNFQQFHMKTETHSDRFWIELDDDEISSRLVFFGKHFWTSENVLLPHVHSAYELMYIVTGEGEIRSQDIVHRLQRGDILIVEPLAEHEGVANPENPFELFFIGYDFSQERTPESDDLSGVDHIFLSFFEAYMNKMKHPVVQDRHGIGPIFFKLTEEMNGMRLCREQIIRAYLQQIFVLMIRNIADYVDTNDVDPKGRDSVQKAMSFIKSRYPEPLSLEKISSHVALSQSYFSRLFKTKTDYTPIEYLNRVRIENAKKYLIHSDLSLIEISERVGFSSQHYFSHTFKKMEGVSPLIYRRTKKKALIQNFVRVGSS
jgi:AraC-like DNA-binding protein